MLINFKSKHKRRRKNIMSKKGGFPGMGGFGGMNLGQLMKEAKKMQADMEKSQTELAAKEFDAVVGGGAVYVKVSGSKEVKEITIKKEAVDPDDVEMLQDLILSCVNEALRKVDSAQAQELGKYNIPGMM
jgi:DNA-binding YbaB/EbfC family protein